MKIRLSIPRREPLMTQVVSERNLQEAWRRVRANEGAPGTDAVRIADFERQLPEQLADLRDRLRAGTYLPEPLRRTQIPKRSGGTRALAIPTVRDRVAQRAFVNVLEPILDPLFLPCSFGYRPGLGVTNAVEQVLAYRAAGCEFALDADIVDFFGSLSHETLIAALQKHIRDDAVLRMIALWLDAGLVGEHADETPPLLESVGAHLQGAAKAFLDFGDDLPESDFADTDTAQALWQQRAWREFGTEVARLVWENRGLLLPLLAKKRGVLLAGGGLLGVAALAGGAWYLAREHKAKRAQTRVGVPQGGPLSPLLSNLYLHAFDKDVTAAKLRLVRYADDFVICTPSEARAEQAWNVAASALSGLKLRLHPEKTRIVSLAKPLEFLGHEIDGDGAVPLSPKATTKPIRLAKTGTSALRALQSEWADARRKGNGQ